jgi:hypothetical protein
LLGHYEFIPLIKPKATVSSHVHDKLAQDKEQIEITSIPSI